VLGESYELDWGTREGVPFDGKLAERIRGQPFSLNSVWQCAVTICGTACKPPPTFQADQGSHAVALALRLHLFKDMTYSTKMHSLTQAHITHAAPRLPSPHASDPCTSGPLPPPPVWGWGLGFKVLGLPLHLGRVYLPPKFLSAAAFLAQLLTHPAAFLAQLLTHPTTLHAACRTLHTDPSVFVSHCFLSR